MRHFTLLPQKSKELLRVVSILSLVAILTVSFSLSLPAKRVHAQQQQPTTANLWVGAAGSCTRSATPTAYDATKSCGTFLAAYNQASNSVADTVLVKGGTYGAFSPTSKSARVSFYAAAGESVTLALSTFGTGNKNVTLSGMTIQGLDVGAQTDNGYAQNITIEYSTFTGQAMFRTNGGTNLNILIDHNKFMPWDKDYNGSVAEGRLSVMWAGGPDNQPDSGVTVSNNEFIGPGCSDGIQLGAAAVHIINNTLHGIYQTSNGHDCANAPWGAHVDAIQIYGAQRTIFRGNVIYDSTTGIINYNGGGVNSVVEDNAVRNLERPDEALGFGGEISPTIRHNVTDGHIDISSSTNADVSDNVVESIWTKCPPQSDFPGNTCGPTGTFVTNDYNLVSKDYLADPNANSGGQLNGRVAPIGPHSIIGNPTFVAGDNYTDLSGAVLAANSLGYHAGTKGVSMGIDPAYISGNTTTSKSADLNNDGKVNIIDVSILLSHLGQSGSNLIQDLDGSGSVTSADLQLLIAAWKP